MDVEHKDNFKIKATNNGFQGFEREKEGNWVSPFFFIQAADTQFGMIESLMAEKLIEKKIIPKWDAEIELTNKAIEIANQMNPKPKFFIVCGDLVNAMPGDKDREPQIKDFKKCFSNLKNEIPLVCVCGNHDVGDSPTPQSIADYRSEYGDDYFTFWVGGVMFIVLNSQYYEDASKVKELAKEQDEWLDRICVEAKSGKYKHVIVFQHIPWFLRDPEEDDEYFNIEKSLREKMLSKLYSSGVRSIFCGHYHRNAGGKYRDLELVVTSAVGAQLGVDKSGFRIVKCLESEIKHEYYALSDVPTKVEL